MTDAIIRVLTPLVLAVEGLRPADIARLVMMNYRVAIRIGHFPRVQLRQIVVSAAMRGLPTRV